ncbi:MAG: hypothetical protein QOK04_1467, partial [Solirubrobacteraceae bacterium]|nr:hypothetical protein [Solirubrobacteraceae bacterium]
MTTVEATAFTDEQHAAIDARSGPLLLSANAGSGKTSVIVERFVAAVLEDGVPVDGILAITFTDKAAAELRQRIRDRFVALDQTERARQLEGAHISTIHGFCAQVLRGHPLPAGLDPAFEVLSDNEAELLRREAFDDAFGDLVDARGEPALELAASYGIPALRELIAGLHDELRSRGHSVPALPDPPPPADPSAARAELAAARAAAAARMAAGRTDLATIVAAQDALDRCATLLESLGEAEADVARL